MPLMKISEYREDYFTPKSRPTQATVKSWIREGYVYGEQLGGVWYVDPERQVVTAKNDLVLKVMSNGP